MITGPKHDLWLVKAAGLLIGVIGVVLTMAGIRRNSAPEVQVLAMGSAASLAAIDFTYALRGRISRVYLLDGGAQIVLIAAWSLGRVVLRGRDKTS
jgi:hypothetical protein